MLYEVITADGEHGQTRVHQVFDQAVVRPHVEHVIFVDPGGDDQQRDPFHFRGRGRVLDQLDETVAVDDPAFRRRQIPADDEGISYNFV